MRVGAGPTGLIAVGQEFVVLEAATGSLSWRSASTGQENHRRAFDSSPTPIACSSAIGGALLAGQRGVFYAWTRKGSSSITRVVPNGSCLSVVTSDQPLREWLFVGGCNKVAAIFYDDTAVYLYAGSLAAAETRRVEVGFTPGALASLFDGQLLVVNEIGDQVAIVDPARAMTRQIIRPPIDVYEEYPSTTPPHPFRGPPVAILSNGRFAYVGSLRADDVGLRSPILEVDLRSLRLEAFSIDGLRFPYTLRRRSDTELVVGGHDGTMLVDLERRSGEVIGPGRLLGYEISPNGRWGVGVDVYETDVWVYDFEARMSHSFPLAGTDRSGELSRIPVCMHPSGNFAAVADMRASEVIIVARA